MHNKTVFRIISIVFLLLSTCCFYLGFKIENFQKMQYNDACLSYEKLFINKNLEVPKDSITEKDLTKVEEKIEKIAYKKEKAELEKNIKELYKYIIVRDKINSSFTDDILNSNVTDTTITEINNDLKKLNSNYQKQLSPKVAEITRQLELITNAKQSVVFLFTDNTFNVVKQDTTRSLYNNAVEQIQNLKQEDIVKEYQEYLSKVAEELTRREKEIARKKEEERKRKIAVAWTILNVPYISQNKNNVLNGCEVASLLMGLQYKGYLKNMDLVTFATNVPKSTDPFQGFTYDIFGLQPNDVPHWIAPAPLAAYGRESAGIQGVIDATGRDLSSLNEEIKKGNPVILWLTSKLTTPKEMVENAPKNLHVLLLTGYNSITGEQIIIDPWTHDDGRTSWQVSKSLVEKIYNSTGKRAVIITG